MLEGESLQFPQLLSMLRVGLIPVELDKTMVVYREEGIVAEKAVKISQEAVILVIIQGRELYHWNNVEVLEKGVDVSPSG